MLYFVHVLLGALIGKLFPKLWIIIILSLVFHFILDIIPHWDGLFDAEHFKNSYKINFTNKFLIVELIDIMIAINLILFIFFRFNNNLMILGIFFSIFPDIAKLGYFTFLRKNKLFKKYLQFHAKIQTEVNWKIGLAIQIIFSIILLKFIIS
tara:strand:- start:80 stop:535 length:456 start_codon:yes stop_codon:yes gene_type:complete